MGSKDDIDPIGQEMGRRIALHRKARGWTQKQLAEATGWHEDHAPTSGLSPSRLANYEQGARRIDHEEAAILEKVFGVPSAYFLVTVNEREAAVLDALRKAG